MKNMISVFTLLLLMNSFITAQEKDFVPVYIAKDVIDNYITSIGGKEKIKKIHTVKIDGKINVMGMDMSISKYVGRDFYYQIMQAEDFYEITSYNNQTGKGWYTKSGKVSDFDKNAVNYYRLYSVNYWGYYLDGYDLGIKYEFDESENNDTNYYCINFIKNDTLLTTMYFDKSNFMKVKSVKDNEVRYFGDFRKVGECGISMPFLIASDDTLKIASYQFNQTFNKQLLDKEGWQYYKP